MKINNNIIKNSILLGLTIFTSISCERNLTDDAVLSTYSKNPEVFIDTFSPNLGYGAFGGSKYSAFSVDTQVKYIGSASMRIDVPEVGDANGTYAGGVYIDQIGRNLTDYDALTFWIKSSHGATINELGFGNDFGLNKYNVTLKNVSVSTNWQKITIPIPDASKLIKEKGMFWYSEGPEDGHGYTFWIDEVKYERLGTIAHPMPSILDGVDTTQQTFIGSNITLTGLTETFNLVSGENKTVSVAPSYYTFKSSNTNVATVSELGAVSIVGSGTAVISATLGGITATGSLTLNSLGVFTPAPTPTPNAANVISIFSNHYTNVPVDTYNGYWGGSTTQGQDDIHINGDDIIKYTQLNYVGIQFSQPTINASLMTYFHIDIQVQNTTGLRNSIHVKLADFGANGVYGGGDDSEYELALNSANLASQNWVSFDVPLSNFTGLINRKHLAQVVLVSASGITDVLVDNIFLHN